MFQKRKIIITEAMIYANGDVHLGHALGYIQADIWAKFQRLRGHDCYYISGTDCHGTPIMLKARELDLDPKAMVEKTGQQQLKDFEDFGIRFDSFYSTDTPENQTLVNHTYEKLKENGDLIEKTIEQAYDEQEQMFLPDRFIKGTCPQCKTADQYGDSCEACGATYDPTDLINPISSISGSTPSTRKTSHLFLDISRYQEQLQEWMNTAQLQKPVVNKLKEWFETGLKPWDVTRDAPYFGFEIPDQPGKFFYVWLDAPLGYIASFQKLAEKQKLDLNEFWGPDSKTELYHVIGKDIAYFHALFWPALMMASNIRRPSGVFVHGFVTINGEKMSKSRGTFVRARDYLDTLSAEFMRYYFAAKLSDTVEDIDINWDDFVARVNADLIGKYVNIASRCAGFIKKKFEGQLADKLMDPELFESFAGASEEIANCYENRHYSKAMRLIMALADKVNQFIEQYKPWELAKDEANLPQVQLVCTQAINAFYQLSIYLKPVLSETAEKVEAFLNIEPMQWSNLNKPLLAHQINKFKPLLMRVDPEAVERFK